MRSALNVLLVLLVFLATTWISPVVYAKKPVITGYMSIYGSISPPNAHKKESRLIIKIPYMHSSFKNFIEEANLPLTNYLAQQRCQIIFEPRANLNDGPVLVIEAKSAKITCATKKYRFHKINITLFRANGAEGIEIPCSLRKGKIDCHFNRAMKVRIEIVEDLTRYLES